VKPSKRNIAIVSSGDPEKDARELEQAYLFEVRIQQNICPNGCGPMIFDDPHNRHCPDCNFAMWCNSPYSGGSEEIQ
jgi:hypothetical protein